MTSYRGEVNKLVNEVGNDLLGLEKNLREMHEVSYKPTLFDKGTAIFHQKLKIISKAWLKLAEYHKTVGHDPLFVLNALQNQPTSTQKI